MKLKPKLDADGRRFPKQWRHWVQLARLKSESGNFLYRKQAHYYTGRGRHWRVNMYGEFQVGEVHGEFDRWANSVEASFPLPKTRDEFVALVKGYKNRSSTRS